MYVLWAPTRNSIRLFRTNVCIRRVTAYIIDLQHPEQVRSTELLLLLYCVENSRFRWNSVALACISFGPLTLFTSKIPSKRFNNWIGKSIVSIISNGWRKGKNHPRKNLLEIPVDVEDDVVYLLHMKILNLKDSCCLGLSFRKMFRKFCEWNGVR